MRLYRSALSALLLRGVLILNLALSVSYLGLWMSMARQGLFWRADFSALYTGWAIARDGRGAELYDMDLQAQYQHQILDGRSFADGLLPYINPPHLTLPFVPLAWLPLGTAFWIWAAAQVLLTAWLLRLLHDSARSWSVRERRLMYAAVLSFPPLLSTLLLGTFSLLMLICLLQVYRALKHSREERAGLWLVVGTIKFQAMLLPGVLLLAARRKRALASALIFGGTLAGIASIWLGWRVWLDFFALLRVVASAFGVWGIDPAKMYTFKAMLTLLLGASQAYTINLLSTLMLGIVAVATLWLWSGEWRPAEPTFELRMALTMLLGLLFSPHLYPHDGLMLIAPALLFYSYLRQRSLPIAGYAALVLSCPVVFLLSEFVFSASLGSRIPILIMSALAVWMSKALVDEARPGKVSLGAAGRREQSDVSVGGEIR
jgi:hypothetical protein